MFYNSSVDLALDFEESMKVLQAVIATSKMFATCTALVCRIYET